MWYRAGTVTTVSGSKNIVGVDTLWTTQASVGDIFTLTGESIYEIESVSDDTHIGLKTVYTGASGSAQAYAIVRNFTSTTTSLIAQKLANMIDSWHLTLDQLLAWETSLAATVPMTNLATGITSQVKPIAGLIADIALKANAANPSTTGTLTHTGNALVSENIAVSGSLQPWYSGLSVVQLPSAALWTPKTGGVTHLSSNMYFDGATYRAILDGSATDHYQLGGSHVWRSATGCTAGNEITAWAVGMELDGSGNLLLKSGAGGVGYGVGSGGTVTQSTSKSTDVTLNKPSGKITMNNAALAAGATVSFRFYNSLMGSTDSFDVSIDGASMTIGHESYLLSRTCWAGGGIISLKNIYSSSISEAVVLNFNIIKGSIS